MIILDAHDKSITSHSYHRIVPHLILLAVSLCVQEFTIVQLMTIVKDIKDMMVDVEK